MMATRSIDARELMRLYTMEKFRQNLLPGLTGLLCLPEAGVGVNTRRAWAESRRTFVRFSSLHLGQPVIQIF